MAGRFAYLKGKTPKPRPARPAEKLTEKIEAVYLRRQTYRAVRRALAAQGRGDVDELVDELLQTWLAGQPAKP